MSYAIINGFNTPEGVEGFSSGGDWLARQTLQTESFNTPEGVEGFSSVGEWRTKAQEATGLEVSIPRRVLRGFRDSAKRGTPSTSPLDSAFQYPGGC